MADPVPAAVTTAVTTVKADATKAVSTVEADIAALKAALTKLEAKTYPFLTTVLVGVGGLVLGWLLHFL